MFFMCVNVCGCVWVYVCVCVFVRELDRVDNRNCFYWQKDKQTKISPAVEQGSLRPISSFRKINNNIIYRLFQSYCTIDSPKID